MQLIRLLIVSVALPLMAQQAGPIVAAVAGSYETAKRNFVEAAQVMPEADYAFKLTPSQRAYGEWVEHTAGMNARMCSTAKGEAAPPVDYGDKSKSALVKALEGSFTYCDAVLKSMTDEQAIKPIGQAPRQTTALAIFISQIANLNGHYGNMVGYMRTKGITPPSTARAQKK